MPSPNGTGVVVANEGIDQLAGNPNFIRPDGTPVALDAPDPTADDSNDEFYGDASSIAAQGTVIYQYSGALPNATDPIPPNCTFFIKGDAPERHCWICRYTPFSGRTQSLAQVVSGVDAAVPVARMSSRSPSARITYPVRPRRPSLRPTTPRSRLA